MNRCGLVVLSFVFLVVSCKGSTAADKEDPPVYQVSNREQVHEAMEAIQQREYDQGDVCASFPDTLPGLVVAGVFAHNRGCKTVGYFFEGVFFSGSDDIAEVVLPALGWKKDDATRKKLAMAWITHVMYATSDIVTDEEAAARLGDGYHVPRLEAHADGGLVVTFWMQVESGKSRKDFYQQHAVVFGLVGTATAEKRASRAIEH